MLLIQLHAKTNLGSIKFFLRPSFQDFVRRTKVGMTYSQENLPFISEYTVVLEVFDLQPRETVFHFRIYSCT